MSQIKKETDGKEENTNTESIWELDNAMGVFDQAARYAAQADSNSFLRQILRDLPLSLQFRQWIDTRTTPLPGN